MSEIKLHYVKCKNCGSYKALTADEVIKLNLIGGKKNFVCYGCISEQQRKNYANRNIRGN
jgi:hypothetical protein